MYILVKYIESRSISRCRDYFRDTILEMQFIYLIFRLDSPLRTLSSNFCWTCLYKFSCRGVLSKETDTFRQRSEDFIFLALRMQLTTSLTKLNTAFIGQERKSCILMRPSFTYFLGEKSLPVSNTDETFLTASQFLVPPNSTVVFLCPSISKTIRFLFLISLSCISSHTSSKTASDDNSVRSLLVC